MPDTDEHLLGATPVDVGAALFSLHDPHAGHERDFNRYYERDHMYSAALLAPFTLAHKARIELSLIEIPFDRHRLEAFVDDELCEHRVAADVSLARRMQRFGIDQANHIT